MQKGGTLVTFGEAGDLPIQRFGLPLRNIVAGLPPKDVLVAGLDAARALRQHEPDRLRHAGRRASRSSWPGGQVYEVTSTDNSQDVEIIATYVERDILQSGWLLGEQVIAKKAAAVTVKHGAGKVVLFGFRPQHRDQTHGTFKLVFNALLNGPGPETRTSMR